MVVARMSSQSLQGAAVRPAAALDALDHIDGIMAARQGYLDALPIAGAVVNASDGVLTIVAMNAQFRAFCPKGAVGSDAGNVLTRPGIAERIGPFLAGNSPTLQYDWLDGDVIGGRHYIVKLSKLRALAGQPHRFMLTLLDRTSAVEAERSLRAEMMRDSLTGLPNRTAFNEALEAAIADEATAAVLVVDLDRFSRINECVGSLVGDELIITVARRLLTALRGGDMLARLGADEFAILLRVHDGPGDALHAAQRIHAALSSPFRLSELEIRIDCAIGCALMNDLIAVPEDLVRNAQLAMKRAKASGRVEVYQPGEVLAARKRFKLETALRRAIENDELTLAYQPIINLETDQVDGFEALARWHHAEQGMIPPSEFISVAEESGLIVPLGRWALGAALRTLAQWDAAAGAPLPLHMSVNVSAVQLARDDVAAMTEYALAANGLAGSRLVMEVTESAIIGDAERSGRILNALKSLGATIAMDDFGTGYTSLSYLQRLPIDILKIDRSFVTGMLADRDSVAIVRAILGLAAALGMATTAEGVETRELVQTLRALGCSFGQGYVFAAPLGREEAFAFYDARKA
jgi:diguanylate cyclase (GGDEF)-like protein